MDFSKNPQAMVLECLTVDLEDRSITTDLSLPAPKETASSEILTNNEQQSIYAAAVATKDTETNTVKSYTAETVDELTLSIPSSLGSDAQELQPGVSSQVNCMLQRFQTLLAEMASQLETTSGMNSNEDSTVVEEKMVIQRESIELGIGEMQACIIYICSAILL